MQQERWDRIVEIMARLAGGDQAALFTLYGEFGDAIAAAVRRELAHFNIRSASPDDLDGLVMDVVLAIGDCGGGWSPDGGALPWVWARHRVRQAVCAFVGQHTDVLDGESLVDRPAQPAPASTVEPAEIEVLARLASTEETCALLLAALRQVTTPRDSEIVLAYKLQTVLGDPSPATTIGAQFGLRPDAVRQVVKRARDKLRRLAATDAGYYGLADLPFLA